MASSSFCRLCALKSDNYVDAFNEEGQKLKLCTKIKQCLQIWLFPEDVLPKTVCTDCCRKVDAFSEFFSTCSQAQVSLVEILNGDTDAADNSLESLEVKLFKGSSATTVVNNVEDADEEIDEQVSEYNVECVITENLLDGSSRKKGQMQVKHDVIGGGEGNDGQPKSNYSEIESRLQHASLTEDLGENKEDSFFSRDCDINRKGPLDGYVWECTECGKELISLPSLKLHYKDVHNQPPIFKCTKCGKVYTRYKSFARHVKLHGNTNKFSCDKCGKCFSQKTVLQSHRTVHSEERPHVCAQCGKAFKQFSSLYLHSKCHLPDQVKPKFPCSVCPKEFSTKHTLDTHMKIHTGERNYICDICGKSFIAKGSLDYHMLTHNDAKPHSCNVCGKGFKTARLLMKHATLHTGIKPHQCDVCGKQFRERGALKEHNRIHTGAMPYSCEFCGKLFRFKGILTVHRRQHTGERPYSCNECNREFTNWANYNKHMKRRHHPTQDHVAQPTTVQDPVHDQVVHVGVQQHPVMHTYPVVQVNDSIYKIPDEHDMFRVPPAYVTSPLQMAPVSYYNIPPIHCAVLQRNQ